MNFKERVFRVVKNIKPGKILTYGQVASLVGRPKSARAVGAVLKTNFDPDIPCHRVIGKSSLGGYNRGINKKEELLKKEGFIWTKPRK